MRLTFRKLSPVINQERMLRLDLVSKERLRWKTPIVTPREPF